MTWRKRVVEAYIGWFITSPNVRMSDESKYGVRPPPLCFGKESVGGQNRKRINYSTEAFAENQALEVARNRLPWLIVSVWQYFKGYLGGQEAILR
jgi:hypothetical protein